MHTHTHTYTHTYMYMYTHVHTHARSHRCVYDVHYWYNGQNNLNQSAIANYGMKFWAIFCEHIIIFIISYTVDSKTIKVHV